MKKLLTLVTLLMTLLAVPFTASAERSGAKASGVPFNKTKVVYLKSLEKTDGEFVKNNPQFRRDEDAVRLTYLGLQKSLKDEGAPQGRPFASSNEGPLPQDGASPRTAPPERAPGNRRAFVVESSSSSIVSDRKRHYATGLLLRQYALHRVQNLRHSVQGLP